MKIGIAIRHVRTKLMIRQGEFALMCSLSQNALSQIGAGRKTPGSYTMNKICSALGIPQHLLFILALQEEDIAEAKRDAFKMIHRVIADLALRIADHSMMA